jgi:carotenoid phi-ring synthase / carotenoid chi-ring synthase
VNSSGGRDRRAVRHLAPEGAAEAGVLSARPRAVVVGGGIVRPTWAAG